MKMPKAVALLLTVSAALPLQAKNKKQPSVPAVFGQAQYVYVQAVDGRQFDPNLYPEDREAIADVQDALSNWRRYVLVMDRDEADLVIVVRRGRAAEAGVGVSPRGLPNSGGIGAGSGGTQTPGQGRAGTPAGGQIGGPAIETGAEVGPSDDFFEVCQLDTDRKLTPPLWERTMPDGLDAPRVLLFQQFREAVDKAYPVQPTQQQKKP